MITCDQGLACQTPSDSSRLSQSSDCALPLTDYPSNILTDMSNQRAMGCRLWCQVRMYYFTVIKLGSKLLFFHAFYTPVIWRTYYVMALSVRTSVRPSVRPSVRSVVHNPCGQDIARTIWPRMLKLSMNT